VDPADLDHAVEVINAHPGVSHNYLRNHEFNLWYTIAVAPTSKLGLEATVDLLHGDSRAISTRLLPTLKLFKIGVRFDLGTDKSKPREKESAGYSDARRTAPDTPLTQQEIAFVRAMQRDLPLVPDPFGAIAAELGIGLDQLQEMHESFLATGRMRRFAAVLHHRKAGFSANAMGVWAGPEDDAELLRLGNTMAGFQAVSHCYRRPSYPDWPYNLFTMVHGKSEEDCEQTLAAIAAATGLSERMALYSSREFKKVRVRYFTDEEARWERSRTLGISRV
jgi:DNA-binding Lrp family transcriptional regulator